MRRLTEHKNGKVESTRNFRPVKLVHYEAYLFKSDAKRREKFLKTTEGSRLLRMQIRDLLNNTGGSPHHPTPVIRQGRPVI